MSRIFELYRNEPTKTTHEMRRGEEFSSRARNLLKMPRWWCISLKDRASGSGNVCARGRYSKETNYERGTTPLPTATPAGDQRGRKSSTTLLDYTRDLPRQGQTNFLRGPARTFERLSILNKRNFATKTKKGRSFTSDVLFNFSIVNWLFLCSYNVNNGIDSIRAMICASSELFSVDQRRLMMFSRFLSPVKWVIKSVRVGN